MKRPLMLPLISIIGGTVAFLLRLWQNRTGFDLLGLPIPGHFSGTALIFWLIFTAILLVFCVRSLPQESEGSAIFPADFSAWDTKDLLLPVTGILLIALSGAADLFEFFTSGNLLAMMQSAADPYTEVLVPQAGLLGTTQLALGLFSLSLAAGLFPAVKACRATENTAFSATPLLIAPVVLVIRLVMIYRLDSANPVLAAYYPEILALIFLTLGFYRFSSFSFQSGLTRRFALYASLAIVASFTALADGGPYLSSLLLYAGGLFTLLGFLLLRLQHTNSSTPQSCS